MPACNAEWNERISAALDGALDPSEQNLLAQHLTACAPCQAQAQAFQQLRTRFAGQREIAVPAHLENRIRAVVAGPRRSPRWRWAVGAAALVAASIGIILWPPVLPAALAQEIEAHHFQAFTHSSPCEFQSSDPVAVRAWLRKRVGYEVEVPALPGCVLLGARRCKLSGVLTASILYRRDGQGVTLFVPGIRAPAARAADRLAEKKDDCVQGRLGETICGMRVDGRPEFLVAERDVDALRQTLDK